MKLLPSISNLAGKFRKLSFPFKVFIFILAATVGYAGYRQLGSGATQAPEYQTDTVTKGTLVSTVSASGQALSVNILSANTLASGIVKAVFVRDGDVVKKGDRILEIDLDFQGQQKYAAAWASYLSAKNGLETAKANDYTMHADLFKQWDTYKELAENDTYSNPDDSPNSENRQLPEFIQSQDAWYAAETKYKNAQSVLAQAQAQVNSAWLSYVQSSPVITAPADGTVTSLMYTQGMTIGTLDTGNSTSNQKVATIRTDGLPIVSVNLSEIDVSRVQLGQKATVTFDSIEDKTFTGSVMGVDRLGATTNGVTQYPAIIQLDTSDPEILPNMAVTTSIVIDTKTDALSVPTAAVSVTDGESFVNTLVDGKSVLVPVTTGLTTDTAVEILSGVTEGTAVITGTQTSSTSSSGNRSVFSGGFGGGMMRVERR